MHSWYDNWKNLDALAYQVKNRELWLVSNDLCSKRPLKADSAEELYRLIFDHPINLVSICASVETFKDPLQLTKTKPESIRESWDFAIDIDAEDLADAKICAIATIKVLEDFGIQSHKVKFSGRRGFHIIIGGIAFDCFASQEFIKAYPIIPKQICRFIESALSPEQRKGVKLDIQMYKPRAQLRAAYSLHHKTELISLPLHVSEISSFNPQQAKPGSLKIDWDWLLLRPRFREAQELLGHVIEWLKTQKPKPSIKKLATGFHKTYAPSGRSRNPPCIEALISEGFSKRLEGYRNWLVYNLLQGIKRLGFIITKDKILELNARSPCPLPEKELDYVVNYHSNREGSYRFKCEIMQEAELCPSGRCPIGRRTSRETHETVMEVSKP